MAVLEIQRRITERDSYTDKERIANIAKVASRFSRWAKEIAFRVAIMDETAASSMESNSSHALQEPELLELPFSICRSRDWDLTEFPLNTCYESPTKRARTSSFCSPMEVKSMWMQEDTVFSQRNHVIY